MPNEPGTRGYDAMSGAAWSMGGWGKAAGRVAGLPLAVSPLTPYQDAVLSGSLSVNADSSSAIDRVSN